MTQPPNKTQAPEPGDLSAAAGRGDVEEIKKLIAAGANINEKITLFDNMTPLMLSISLAETETAACYLIENGADISSQDTPNSATPLIWSIHQGRSKVVEALLKKGVPVDYITAYGGRALNQAVGQHSTRKELIPLLLDHGANINLTDHKGQTVLMQHIASFTSHLSRYKPAQSLRVDYKSWFETLDLLIQRGAFLLEPDNTGKTALDIATDFAEICPEFSEVVQILNNMPAAQKTSFAQIEQERLLKEASSPELKRPLKYNGQLKFD